MVFDCGLLAWNFLQHRIVHFDKHVVLVLELPLLGHDPYPAHFRVRIVILVVLEGVLEACMPLSPSLNQLSAHQIRSSFLAADFSQEIALCESTNI